MGAERQASVGFWSLVEEGYGAVTWRDSCLTIGALEQQIIAFRRECAIRAIPDLGS